GYPLIRRTVRSSLVALAGNFATEEGFGGNRVGGRSRSWRRRGQQRAWGAGGLPGSPAPQRPSSSSPASAWAGSSNGPPGGPTPPSGEESSTSGWDGPSCLPDSSQRGDGRRTEPGGCSRQRA